MASDRGRAAGSGFCIFGPWQDVSFVLLTPGGILLAFAAARRGGWLDGLIAFGLALAMAHYLPGMLRAYGDPSLFRRFRTRLIVAPLFLLATTAWFAYLNLHIIVLIATLWAVWHWLMQIYGFVRIYDAKAAPAARFPSRLDQALCIAWFGMCAIVFNNTVPTYAETFYLSGGPRVPAEIFARLVQVWVAATVVITLLYLLHTLKIVRSGTWPNPLKFVLLIGTFVYLAYTVSIIEQPVMGMVLFESWHDIQYLAIVWMFNVNRARRGPEAGRFTRFLFRPNAGLVVSYVVLCLAFGSLTHAWHLFSDETIIRVVIALVSATAMFHYYLDGFIWKIREKETGQALGVDVAQQPVMARRAIPAWAMHSLLWLLFVVPAALFFVVESKGSRATPLKIYEDLAKSFPDSAKVNDELGRQLMAAGRTRESKAYFERASKLSPGMLQPRLTLGVLLAGEGDVGAAVSHFEYALKLDPLNAQVHNQLGMIFGESGDLMKAKEQLELAIKINPEYALAQNNLGIVLRELGNVMEARVHHELAVRIDPKTAEFQYQLGVTMTSQSELDGAIDHLQQALRIQPNNYLAHDALGEVLLRQGRLTEAKQHFRQALWINPSDESARQGLAENEQQPR